MIVRKEACCDLANKCKQFVNMCEKKGETYRLPTPANILPEDDVRDYFERHVGPDGMIVTVARDTMLIVNAALRTKVSANKKGNFLSSIACSLICLLQCQKMKFATEFIELISVVGYMSNIY
jgi:hypothetical protein